MTEQVPETPAPDSPAARRGGGGFWSRLAAITLMLLVLFVAGTLSAVTAMRFVIQGREVLVPEVTGTREEAAGRVLEAAGLALVVDSRRFSAEIPEGGILEQSPRAGRSVKRDRSVRVRVSLGPREFAVPDLKGTSLRSGEMQLSERGLATGSTFYVHTTDGDPGTVVFQYPDPGDTETDPAVDVVVSLGPAAEYFVMPRLVGRTAAETRRAVRDAGFRLSEIPASDLAGGPPGRVVTQQPPAGHRVSRSDSIVVGVSQ
jgi:serine/threonine-protein kinase